MTYTSSATITCGATWEIWATSATTYDVTWQGWCSNTLSATTTNTSIIWHTWVEGTQCITTNQRRQPSAEEIAEAKRVDQERIEAQRIKEAAKQEKARQLLREVLTDEQDKQFDEKGYFELVSVKSGNRYRVHKGRSMNVELLKADGTVKKRLCFHPSEYVHDYDTLVSQKLMLENYEDEVKKVANYS